MADIEAEDEGCSVLFPDSDDEQQTDLCRLPQRSSDYSTPEYWASRYAKEEDIVYDWYGLEYRTFWENHLKPLVVKAPSILLELGSGNSEWSSCMASSGLWVISTDIDIGVLQAISKNDGGAIVERVAVDARRLPFRQSIFDFVVDKGTLDALFCSHPFPTEIVSEIPKRLNVNIERETTTFSKRENFVGESENKVSGGNKVFTFLESCQCDCHSSQLTEQENILPQISSIHNGCIIAGHCIIEKGLWKKELSSGFICVPAIFSQKTLKNPNESKSRELNNIMLVGKGTGNVMKKGGSWMIVTAKQPFQILEAMRMNIWDGREKGYREEPVNWFHVQTYEKECGVYVIKLTKW